jgi:tetratricopeptide (TPR) repeat protein
MGTTVRIEAQTEDATPNLEPIYIAFGANDRPEYEAEFLERFISNLNASNVPYEIIDPLSDEPNSARVTLDYMVDGQGLIVGTSVTVQIESHLMQQHSPFLSDNLPSHYLIFTAPADDAADFVTGLILYSTDNCNVATSYLEKIITNPFEPTRGNRINHIRNFYLGNCKLLDENYLSAIEHYEKVRQMQGCGLVYPAYINEAWAYLQIAETENAAKTLSVLLDDMKWCLADDAEFVFAFTKRSQLYALAFRYDEAIADMNAAIELEPDNPELYVERGQRILLTYEWDDVLADYNHAIELDPDYAPAYFHRSVLFYTQGPRENALPDFQRYLELAPNGEFAGQAATYIEEIEAQLTALED